MLRDFNVEWLEKRIYIPCQAMQSQTDAGSSAFLSAGVPVFQEIGSTNLAGVQIHAASDAVNMFGMIPYDLDITKQVRLRVWVSKTSTDADVETITVLYSAIAEGAALVEPATALSTAIPAYTFGTTSGAAEATGFGIINRNTIGQTAAFWGFNIASTMTNASADEINLLGLEIRYTPRRMAGPRRNILGGRRLKAGYPGGVQLHTAQEGL